MDIGEQQLAVQKPENTSWPSPYRFVRCNPRFNIDETVAILKSEVNHHPYPVKVPWLSTYYALPSDFNLQKSELYRSARIYGQDVSSGASVAALLSSEFDYPRPSPSNAPSDGNLLRVLDLCCCPGLKLCSIADALYSKEKAGEIVGVDISDARISVCKRVLQKYQIKPSMQTIMDQSDFSNERSKRNIRIQVFCNDGTIFPDLKQKDLNLAFDSVAALDDEVSRCGKRKRMNKSARARQQKNLKTSDFIYNGLCDDKNLECTDPNHVQLFDRVLVDAECSTDGSVVHAQKRSSVVLREDLENGSSSEDFNTSRCCRTSNHGKGLKLFELQRSLAASGFRLLRKGGYMVYSTCSLLEEENDRVVQWLLTEFPNARIVPVNVDMSPESKNGSSCLEHDLWRHGKIPGTIQFLPNLDSRTCPTDFSRLFGGGFYLAKITKE